MSHTQINPYILIACRKFLRLFHFARERDIPLIDFVLDGDCLDLADYRAMEDDLALPDLGEMQRSFELLSLLFSGELPTRSIRIGEAIIAVAALKPWITWIFSIQEPPEEVLKCLVKASQDIL